MLLPLLLPCGRPEGRNAATAALQAEGPLQALKVSLLHPLSPDLDRSAACALAEKPSQ